MGIIKEIQEIKQKYSLEDFDIWCIKFEIFGDDYNHVPNEIIKKIVDNKELSVIFSNFKK